MQIGDSSNAQQAAGAGALKFLVQVRCKGLPENDTVCGVETNDQCARHCVDRTLYGVKAVPLLFKPCITGYMLVLRGMDAA
jgi:hypothetical protein